MTLTELRYLLSLAEEKHFGRAAERCHVSQPTLSVAIRKLEQRLKVQIFERGRNRVMVTPIGDKLVAQAKNVIEQADRLEMLARNTGDELAGPLKIGAIFTVAPYLFPHMIPQLRKIAPDMTLDIEENYTAVLRERLRNGQIDIAIVALPFTEADVLTKPLFSEPFEVLLPTDHPLARKASITAEELADNDLLLLGEGHCFRDQILDACPSVARSSRDPEGRVRTLADGSSLETIRHMVASGLGLTILPRSANLHAPYSADWLVTRPFTRAAPERTVAIAWRASFPRPRAIDALEKAIKACRI
ncbi:hydrogen peroxide-inducible genes activator [Natronospirillum operosum]|uniref:Hydrogen peroxide-inducible genes activator n=1 Tax=Natronospirillum operosum TaxID=2759953 RepID=A0A4Z0WJN0_9GAMM|nr:hydrogen peroxide-inducible genes activator [Natronospirillum operosum]TGG95355.1 hydrogen peroxide-inducible genes activator [Natronospirillum operosum]